MNIYNLYTLLYNKQIFEGLKENKKTCRLERKGRPVTPLSKISYKNKMIPFKLIKNND